MAKKTLATSRKISTGPRSFEGKERSKLNAVKHGIFAAVVLPSESAEEYQELLADLIETYQPVRRLESILVEKLAVLIWRFQRLIRAEAAEIERASLVRERGWGGRITDMELADALWKDRGSIARAFLSHREETLASDVQTLKELREQVRGEGLNWQRDKEDLFRLYGRTVEAPGPTDSEQASTENSTGKTAKGWENPFVAEYRTLAVQAEGVDRRGKTRAAALMTERLDEQIEFVQAEFMKGHYRKERLKQVMEAVGLVPAEKETERLLRYEAGLERVFDRTLSQLERLQRMRLGHPVVPPLKVELSA